MTHRALTSSFCVLFKGVSQGAACETSPQAQRTARFLEMRPNRSFFEGDFWKRSSKLSPQRRRPQQVRTAEAFKVKPLWQEKIQMNTTSSTRSVEAAGSASAAIVQACTLMHAHLEAHCRAFMRVSASLTAAQHEEMVRAGSHMWAVVAAVKADALARAADCDPGYQAFKAQLMAKPKRARKARRAAA